MKKDNDNLRGPITFLIAVLILEGLLGALAGAGLVWGGILLCVVLSIIQIITLILLWFAFRLLIRVNDRLKHLEHNNTKE